VVVTPSVPVRATSGVRARVPAAGKVLEGDDKPTLLREDQHYLHYITIKNSKNRFGANLNDVVKLPTSKTPSLVEASGTYLL